MKYLKRAIPGFFGAAVLAAGLLLSPAKSLAAYDYTVLGDGGLLGGFSVKLDTTTESGILVGGIHVKPSTAGSPDFISVCLDLRGKLFLGSTYSFTQTQFAGQTGLNPAWGNPLGTTANPAAAYQAINNAAHLYATIQPTTATQWAALQLAVWKVLYDTDATGKIVTGETSRFSVLSDGSSGAWATAQGWLNGFTRNTDYVGYILRPSDLKGQQLLIGVTASTVPAVPEPSTMLAGLLLLVPICFSAARRLRKNQ